MNREDDQTMNGLPGARLRRVTEFIDDNLARALPLADLSAEAHMSQYHFARLFKESTGLPPHRFVVQRRIERARELLAAGQLSIDAIARAVGFRTRSHFSMMFHRLTGASKVAFAACVARLRERGFLLFDVQVLTAHLSLLGCSEIPRDDYRARVREALQRSARFG